MPWTSPEQGYPPEGDTPEGDIRQPPKRRRINGKTRPGDTDYADIRPKGTSLQQAKRRAATKGVKKANANRLAAATLKGQAAAANNLAGVNALADKLGEVGSGSFDTGFVEAIHPSHQLRAVKDSPEAFFCFKCGGYNNGGPLRSLRRACPGAVAAAHASQHRLLTCGILPKPGTLLPATCRRG